MRNKWLKRLAVLMTVAVIALVGAVKLPMLWREVTFYWTERTETELKIKKYAEEKGIFYSEYPDSLIALL